MLKPVEIIEQISQQLDQLTYDKESIPQAKLDLVDKQRTSLFPWRGQFSPQLIQILLEVYANKNSVILDPFLGSGTTLFEASRQNLTAYGADINPAAIEMAKTIYFVNLDSREREKVIKKTYQILDQNLLPFESPLFAVYQENQSELQVIKNLIENQDNFYIKNLLINATIRYFKQKNKTISYFRKSLVEQIEVITNLPYNNQIYKVFHSDAKSIALSKNSVDLIITSPPYINVFNYHQNNREAMEFLGWNLLNIAKSEIGANRKHRQNRFLTVVQYSLDMLTILKEMHRLLKTEGRLIIVIGRTSTVRNTIIDNSKLVAILALGNGNFKLEKIQERKFKNKFGQVIFEDILHLIPQETKDLSIDNFAYLVAQFTLEKLTQSSKGDVLDDIIKAIKSCQLIQESPLFTLSNDEQ